VAQEEQYGNVTWEKPQQSPEKSGKIELALVATRSRVNDLKAPNSFSKYRIEKGEGPDLQHSKDEKKREKIERT